MSKPPKRDPPSEEDWLPELPEEPSLAEKTDESLDVSQVSGLLPAPHAEQPIDTGTAQWPALSEESAERVIGAAVAETSAEGRAILAGERPPNVPRIEPGAVFDLEETLPPGVVPPLTDLDEPTSKKPHRKKPDRQKLEEDELPEHPVELTGSIVMETIQPPEALEEDPTTLDTTPPPGSITLDATPPPGSITLDATPPEFRGGTAPAPAVAVPASLDEMDDDDDTVMLDVEQQDKLMQLRAQQDQRLRQTYSGEMVVMFTDLVDSTAYYEKYGDLVGRQKLLSHNALLFPIIRTNSGTIVKTIGDGIMACFKSAEAAVTAAETMQHALEEFNRASRNPDEEIHIRVGLNAGPAIAEDGDLHGDAVNVASRVQAKASADEVLLTGSVTEQVGDRQFELIGPVELKGKAAPIDVYRLGWRRVGPPLQREAARLIGTRYRVGQTLGRGPLGVVYSAEDVRLRVPVAIKILHEFVSRDPRFADIFLDRVQTMASLLHPNIVRVLDCSAVWAEEPYYITERIDGRDLGAWVVRNGCPPPKRAARLLAQVGEAIDFGHRHGVVHGNLKPENILVRSDGVPSVSDFGLGFFQQLEIANAGGPLFPPSYQAPEQVMGEHRIDPRTDVYGLGAVIYYVLAGRPPYDPSATLRAQRAVASGMYKRLHRVRPDLPHYITEVTAKAMAHKPGDRFATVRELTDALHAFASEDADDS